jgi:pheromone shutdown protein TraB
MIMLRFLFIRLFFLFLSGVTAFATRSGDVKSLIDKYPSRVSLINQSCFPCCDIYLCGTLHVSNSSVVMVSDCIETLKPSFVVVELCESRIDVLEDRAATPETTLKQILYDCWKGKSFKSLGVSFLSWMQQKAASSIGSKLGEELAASGKAAYAQGSTVILGDRKYSVTIQRSLDRLTTPQKIKLSLFLLFEVATLGLGKLKEYILKSETEPTFVDDELAHFAKRHPGLAEVIISERDEYLSQTIAEVARLGFASPPSTPAGAEDDFGAGSPKGSILAVVGAGHVPGIKRHLSKGGVSLERIRDISRSSKHNATWPDMGMMHVVDLDSLYGNHMTRNRSATVNAATD